MNQITDLYKREPARVNGVVATIVVGVLVHLGAHVSLEQVLPWVATIAPLVFAELTRTKVSPATE
ncbi:MAG: hypothetical protein AAGC46_16165 [Solirubrobacteraceae bacterium]|nr:hypothetical protein [Patulibacter sp.]